MEEKIDIWLVGNTGLRNPNRIQEVYEDEQDMVIDAIKMCKNAVTKSKLQPYQATRNATVFAQIQKDVN